MSNEDLKCKALAGLKKGQQANSTVEEAKEAKARFKKDQLRKLQVQETLTFLVEAANTDDPELGEIREAMHVRFGEQKLSVEYNEDQTIVLLQNSSKKTVMAIGVETYGRDNKSRGSLLIARPPKDIKATFRRDTSEPVLFMRKKCIDTGAVASSVMEFITTDQVTEGRCPSDVGEDFLSKYPGLSYDYAVFEEMYELAYPDTDSAPKLNISYSYTNDLPMHVGCNSYVQWMFGKYFANRA
ncbi:hypothetical protein GYA49_04560 [Candidatus Beckwithbacteria bacterium]|nr:hypothetical protein [Candidatus Beckwithbacteria bacterium]